MKCESFDHEALQESGTRDSCFNVVEIGMLSAGQDCSTTMAGNMTYDIVVSGLWMDG